MDALTMTRAHWKNEVHDSMHKLDMSCNADGAYAAFAVRAKSPVAKRKLRKAKHGTIRSGFTVFERGQGNENATKTNSGPKAQAGRSVIVGSGRCSIETWR